MDIKVLCPCGAKYQFPVEPVNGLLPQSIACPVCGADNTDLGNAAIQAKLASEPVAAPAATPAPPGLRVTAHPATPPLPSPARPVMATPFPGVGQPPKRGQTTFEKAKKIGSTIVTVVLVVIGAYALYTKWSKRVGRVSNLVSALTGSDESSSSAHWTLPADSGSAMLVKASDHSKVAEMFAATYAETAKQTLNVLPATDELGDDDSGFLVFPSHKGAVEIIGPTEWAEPQASAMGAALSKQLNTFVVVSLMGDDAESGEVSIYENGERRFRLKRWYRITKLSEDGIKEFMEREGEAWAAQHGYVPGPAKVLTGDTEAMPFEDVNDLVVKLGMDTSDSPEEPKGVLLLKGNTAAPKK